MHDKALEEARAKQAKVRSEVTAAEKKVKKAEKALDSRVSFSLLLMIYNLAQSALETRPSGNRE